MSSAHLARISIFPIKSLDGVELQQVDVLEGGALAGDRRFAVIDLLGRYVNGKRTPAVHQIRAEYELAEMRVRLRRTTDESWTTFSLENDRQDLADWFSSVYGVACVFAENAAGGFPDDRDAPGPTVVSTATLKEVAGWFPGLELEEVRRRFRANLEIDGVKPFWEDRLVGASRRPVEFMIGNVPWLGMKACERCVVPSRSSQDGEATRGFQKTFAEQRERLLPSWAPADQFDHYYHLCVNTRPGYDARPATLRVGDAVCVF